MARDKILYREIPLESRVKRASRFAKQIEIINKSSPIKECFELAEVSYGYDAGNNVNYLDYPYPSIEKGKVVDTVNLATRGELPEDSPLDNDTYKNLDIEIAKVFDEFKNKTGKFGYILYEFIPNTESTPIITDIKTNIEFITDEILRKYFFVIYHCSDLNYNLNKIFLKEPILDRNLLNQEKKYLLYFNSKNMIELENGSEVPEVITCAFISKGFIKIDSEFICSEKNIDYIYNIVIEQLIYVATHSREYHELQSALCKYENKRQQLVSSYDMMHTLKNRFSILVSSANDLNRLYKKSITLEDIEDAVNICINTIYSIKTFPDLAYLSYFSNVYEAHKVYHEKESDNKYKFSTIEPFNFSSSIEKMFDIIKNTNVRHHYEYKLIFLKESIKCIVFPHFNLEKNDCVRLEDYVYESIIFEIIYNFSIHSSDHRDKRILYIKYKNNNSISFINKIKLSKIGKKLNPIEKLTRGLSFVSNILKNTESGFITHEIVNNKYYEVTLNLNGLLCQEKK